MKIILDLDVLLDVIMNRESHYLDSAFTVSKAISPSHEALIPSHSVTTLYYLVSKGSNRERAEHAVDWLIASFEIALIDKEILLQARRLDMRDFEDAVVAVQAEKAGCDFIVSRNIADYRSSPVKAITPGEFLDLLDKML